jgi:aspartyl-tRNA(Asn)/glutamyl-tRNA(Gln) amidotransferase subunit A
LSSNHSGCEYLTIEDLHRRIRTSDISPVDVVDAALACIDALNPALNAFATVLHDESRRQARQAEAEIKAGRWRGPLHGIPVGIKDFYDTAGIRTTAAFEPFRNRVPAADAAAVRTLKEAGAIIVGKTNMHQLGMGTTGLESCFGPVRNPWNEAYIPGGSSSGSAAAVAAGLCYATLDTDAIGSCRLPASCCGVVGFKGTFALIDTRGILEGEKADETILRLAHAGITTRAVEDTAIMLNALADPREYHVAPRRERLRIGRADRFSADDEIARAFDAAVEKMGTLHEIGSVHAPFDMPPFGDVHAIEADRQTVAGRAFADVDVVLLPTTAATVPTVESARGKPQALSAANTLFANYFGLPAISVPCGFDARGLPIGLQIVGKPREDGIVLALARESQSLGFSTKR